MKSLIVTRPIIKLRLSAGIEITVIDMNTYQGQHFLYSDMVKEILELRRGIND